MKLYNLLEQNPETPHPSMQLVIQTTENRFKKRFHFLILFTLFILAVSVFGNNTNTPTPISKNEELIKLSAQFQNPSGIHNSIRIYNIIGEVSIEGYDGTEIRIEALKSGDNKGDIRSIRLLDDLNLVMENDGQTILIYLDAPFIKVEKRADKISYNLNSNKSNLSFRFDIKIKVPNGTATYASTITDGDVSIINLSAPSIEASNVNGNVFLTNIDGMTKACTVNGNIEASYAGNPRENSEYETVNGTIDVHFPRDLSADIRFKSMFGDLYSDFENIQFLHSRVEQTNHKNGTGSTYRVEKFTPFRIGNGGPEFRFEVLTGNVYIRKI